jgi:hypothetical protein
MQGNQMSIYYTETVNCGKLSRYFCRKSRLDTGFYHPPATGKGCRGFTNVYGIGSFLGIFLLSENDCKVENID